MDDLSYFFPKFRWGNVAPTAGGNRVRRGPGYQWGKIIPDYVIEIAAGKGMEELLEAGDPKGAEANYWEAAGQLAKEKVDFIVMGGAPVSANFGRAKVLTMLKQTRERFGVPATTPIESFLAGMKHLGVRRVAVASRWPDDLNERVMQYLRDGGMEPVGITSRDQAVGVAHGITFEEGMQVTLDVTREAAKDFPTAEAIFVPGGATMTLHVVPIVEQEAGKPVVTNLTGEVWEILVRTGVIPPVQGWGRLLATP
jgi:maleate cis-trans isomerase